MSWKREKQKLESAKLPEINQAVCVDEQAGGDYAEAEQRLELARTEAKIRLARAAGDAETTVEKIEQLVDADADVVKAEEVLHKARTAYRRASVDFTFRALPKEAWEELTAKHPAREGKQESWNHDTLTPELMAACHVYYEKDDLGDLVKDDDGNLVEGDGMTVQDALDLPKELSSADYGALRDAVFAVNLTSRIDFHALGKG